MWFTVRCDGVAVGTVHLVVADLAAGRLVTLPAYAQIAHRVRAASNALMRFGLYGPRPSAIASSERRAARRALYAGAALRVDLVPFGRTTAAGTVFINLVAAPGDSKVVVIARFADETADVGAARSTTPRRDIVRHEPPPNPS